MSRSYKKVLGFKDVNSFMKKYSNKVIRKVDNVPSYSGYKKVMCTWNICDWKDLYHTEAELLRDQKYSRILIRLGLYQVPRTKKELQLRLVKYRKK